MTIAMLEAHDEFRLLRAWKRISLRDAAKTLEIHENSLRNYEAGGRTYSDTHEKIQSLLAEWRKEWHEKYPDSDIECQGLE